MVKTQKPDLDEATLQIAKRILSMPPNPHSEMKVGKRKTHESGPKHMKKREKSKRRARSSEDDGVRIATLLCGDEQLGRDLLSKLYPTSASSQSSEARGR
jgi:hypothetical protein